MGMDEDGIQLDLICENGHEYTAILFDNTDSVETTCPLCNKKEIVTRSQIESALDNAQKQALENLGL